MINAIGAFLFFLIGGMYFDEGMAYTVCRTVQIEPKCYAVDFDTSTYRTEELEDDID